MKELTINIENGSVLRLHTRPSNDIEVVLTRGTGGKFNIGGGTDEIIGIIPKSKRCEVAQFLTEA